MLVRDQSIGAQEQARYCRWLGEIRPPDAVVHPGSTTADTHTFVDSDGPGRNYELYRHQDYLWIEPVRGICLYGLEIPSVGGETVFYDATAALERLDPALRARLEGLEAVHFDRFAAGRKVVADQPQERRWPVVLAHPETATPILFVNEQTVKTLCLDDAQEAAELLAALLAAFDDPEVQYVHTWRQGDVVVWDNLSLQHSRRAFPADQHRNLRRVQIA